jgi:dienelactone hydrolase
LRRIERADTMPAMNALRFVCVVAACACAGPSQNQPGTSPRPERGRVVDIRATDGTPLKATYFPAAGPGPAVLLLAQSNRTRESWNDVGAQLAAAGIHALAVDLRGLGDSGSAPFWKLSPESKLALRAHWSDDVEVALAYLQAQPGVRRDLIGMAGAGSLGVAGSVEAASHHPREIASLVLMSGEAERDGTEFLRHANQLPELFVFSDDDEYPPTQDAMKLLYLAAASSSKLLVHYPAVQDAPWLWYETFDPGRVAAKGGHGTDLFGPHPELPSIIVHWFTTSLLKTPRHAPPDALAAAAILEQLQAPGGAAQVTQQLLAARQLDPQAQLWPEVACDLVGEHLERAGAIKDAIAVFELNALAYPDSADAQSNLADAYLSAGQKQLARQHAEKGLAMLDAHATPASSWSDTEPRRGEIRQALQDTLAKARQ